MQKTLFYGPSRWAGDVFHNIKTKETTLELNLGFAGRFTLYITNDKVKVGEEEKEILRLTKVFLQNGKISQVRVGSLFKNTSKSGVEYYSGSFGLGVYYDKEKDKTLTTSDNDGISLQLFKLAQDKRKKISDDIVKIGYVNMQMYIVQHPQVNDGIPSQQGDASQESDSINEEEIPF